MFDALKCFQSDEYDHDDDEDDEDEDEDEDDEFNCVGLTILWQRRERLANLFMQASKQAAILIINGLLWQIYLPIEFNNNQPASFLFKV